MSRNTQIITTDPHVHLYDVDAGTVEHGQPVADAYLRGYSISERWEGEQRVLVAVGFCFVCGYRVVVMLYRCDGAGACGMRFVDEVRRAGWVPIAC